MAYQMNPAGDLFERIAIDLGLRPSLFPLARREPETMPSLSLCERIPPEFSAIIPLQVRIVVQPRRRLPKRLTDVLLPFGQWIVCDLFRKIVEDLEPQQHQFFPVSFIVDKTAERFETADPYFFMNILRYLPPLSIVDTARMNGSVIESEEKFANGYVHRTRMFNVVSNYTDTGLVLKRPAISDHHLWSTFGKMEDGVFIGFPHSSFVSDVLHARLMDAKIDGIRMLYVPESD